VGTHLQQKKKNKIKKKLDEEFVASATAVQLTNKIQAMFYERDLAAKTAETKRLQETVRRLMEPPAETGMESLQRMQQEMEQKTTDEEIDGGGGGVSHSGKTHNNIQQHVPDQCVGYGGHRL
jgi:hypothetical protein